MSRGELLLRVTAIGLALVTPYICITTQGLMMSYSAYWTTPLQPLFIITNAITSYYLFDAERWKPSALLLLLLTAFSMEQYPVTHNIFAIAFFIACITPLALSNHYKWTLIPYVLSIGLLAVNMMLAETLAITTLAVYHGSVLYRLYLISKLKNK